MKYPGVTRDCEPEIDSSDMDECPLEESKLPHVEPKIARFEDEFIV